MPTRWRNDGGTPTIVTAERLGTAIVRETKRLNDRLFHMTLERLIDRCERLGSPLFLRIPERLVGR